MATAHLKKARKVGDDEYYTQRETIEKELPYYKKHLRGKVIYCNCDDHRKSQFYKYFADNGNSLQIKDLLHCHFDKETECGDFRSEKSIELLRTADIVITNPPFSLFREYMQQLFDYDKKFLILGPVTALTYKNITPKIVDNKVWCGVDWGDKRFNTPSGDVVPVASIWYTNLDYTRRYRDLELKEVYSEEKYPLYDNIDARECGRVAKIPCDYDGVLGVPVSFMQRYNPLQFEIISDCRPFLEVDGELKELFRRFLIRKRKLS